MTRKLFVLAIAMLFIGVSATWAGPLVRKDKGASNNGLVDTYTKCATTVETCANFGTSLGSIGGADIVQFVENSGSGSPGAVQEYEVFQIPGSIVAGDVLTMNFTSANNDYGIFACGNGTGGAVGVGSGGTEVPLTGGPCTVGDLFGGTPLTSFISESDSTTTPSVSFTFLNLPGLPSSWTFLADPNGLTSFTLTPPTGGGGGTTTAPEPGSASLLLAGALAAGLLACKARR